MLLIFALLLVAASVGAKKVEVCPDPPAEPGVCVNLCADDCSSSNQLCCFNGCGHQCMDPVIKDIEPSPPPVRGVCPKPTGLGLCAENCDNCRAKGQLCCSNGCGHECMKPVIPTCPKPQGVGICVNMCFECLENDQLCCSNGCGHECMDPVYE